MKPCSRRAVLPDGTCRSSATDPASTPRRPPRRARSITLHTLQRARRARRELLLLVPLLVGVDRRLHLPRASSSASTRPCASPPRVVLVDPRLGARARPRPLRSARALPPHGPGTAGHGRLPHPPVVPGHRGRSSRCGSRASTPRTLAVGGAFTAVIFGLAAQQTLGNLIAGMVLISARPFRVGDRVRLQAGGARRPDRGHRRLARPALHRPSRSGEDSIMVPNNVVLARRVVPLREPAAVDLRARLRPDVKPSEVQALLERGVTTPVRAEPHIALEEVDADEVVVRDRRDAASRRRRPAAGRRDPAAIAAVTRDGDRTSGGRRGEPARDERTTWQPDGRRAAARLGSECGARRGAAGPSASPRCARPSRSAISSRAEPPLHARRRARAARPATAAPRRSAQRRDVDLGAVALDRPHDRARRRRSGVLRRRRPGSFAPDVVEHARVADEAGEARSRRRRRSRAGPRAARARTRAGRTSSPSRAPPPAWRACPTARRRTRGGRGRARPSPGDSARASTIGARRLTSSARSISSDVNVVEPPAGGQRRVGDEHVDRRRPRRAARVDRRRSARSHATARAAELGRQRLEHVGAPPGQHAAARRAPPARARSPGRCRRSRPVSSDASRAARGLTARRPPPSP